jgi:hypothetical protein
MPVPLLNAYAEQLPRLHAEESLQAFERIAAGTRSLRRGAARQLLSSWQRQTEQQRVVVRPKNREAYEAQMAMAGVGVKRVAVKRDD